MALTFGKKDAAEMAETLEPDYAQWVSELKGAKADLKKAQADDDFLAETQAEERIADLDQRLAEVEAFAKAALLTAYEVIQGKANYTVLGRLAGTDLSELFALGWYATETQAWSAMESLAYLNATGESVACWVVPVFTGSPAEYGSHRKTAQNEALEARKEQEREAFEWQSVWLNEHLAEWFKRVAPNEVWPEGESPEQNTKPTWPGARKAWTEEVKRRKKEDEQ